MTILYDIRIIFCAREVRTVEEAIPLKEEGYEKADEIEGVGLYRKTLL